jgi:chaperone required for assembly of F1-ATPase
MTEPARRFYKTASVTEHADGFAVALDQRTLRTPKGAPFIAPTRGLAEAIAQEWNAQGEHIVPASMPITQLAFAAIDVTPERRDELARTVAKYVETDLVCHRAPSPAALVERQEQVWGPIHAWAGERFHMRLPVVVGVTPAEIPPQHRTVIEWEVDDLDDFRRTALAQAASLAGSALIGFALLEGRLTADDAYRAAALDEEWSLERWGEDAEARAKLDTLRAALEDVARFVVSLR